MAAALKDQFGTAVIERIADEVAAVHPAFDRQRFVTDAHDGFDALELMPRARHIARALRRALPEDFPQAIGILLASLGPHGPRREGEGMSAFRHLPHVLFVAEFGLEHFEAAMHAQHDLIWTPPLWQASVRGSDAAGSSHPYIRPLVAAGGCWP